MKLRKFYSAHGTISDSVQTENENKKVWNLALKRGEEKQEAPSANEGREFCREERTEKSDT